MYINSILVRSPSLSLNTHHTYLHSSVFKMLDGISVNKNHVSITSAKTSQVNDLALEIHTNYTNSQLLQAGMQSTHTH